MPSDTAWTVCSPSARSRNGYSSRPATSAVQPIARRAVALTPSRLVGGRLAEESARTEDEDQDENREDDRVGPAGRDVLVAPRRQESDEESAERRARHVADATEHGGGEGAEARLVPHPPLADVVVHALDESGGARRSEEHTSEL